jgi:hypothetical protein
MHAQLRRTTNPVVLSRSERAAAGRDALAEEIRAPLRRQSLPALD